MLKHFLIGAFVFCFISNAVAQDASELTFWQSIRDSKEAEEFEAYLNAYPDGKFAPLARIRAREIKGAESPKKAKPTVPEASLQQPTEPVDRESTRSGSSEGFVPAIFLPMAVADYVLLRNEPVTIHRHPSETSRPVGVSKRARVVRRIGTIQDSDWVRIELGLQAGFGTQPLTGHVRTSQLGTALDQLTKQQLIGQLGEDQKDTYAVSWLDGLRQLRLNIRRAANGSGRFNDAAALYANPATKCPKFEKDASLALHLMNSAYLLTLAWGEPEALVVASPFSAPEALVPTRKRTLSFRINKDRRSVKAWVFRYPDGERITKGFYRGTLVVETKQGSGQYLFYRNCGGIEFAGDLYRMMDYQILSAIIDLRGLEIEPSVDYTDGKSAGKLFPVFGPEPEFKKVEATEGAGGATVWSIQKIGYPNISENAGFQIGDIIHSIDDVMLPDKESLNKVLSQLTPGKATKFQLMRDGNSRTVSLEPVTRRQVFDRSLSLASKGDTDAMMAVNRFLKGARDDDGAWGYPMPFAGVVSRPGASGDQWIDPDRRRWLRRAAEKGNPQALLVYANMLRFGTGGRTDKKDALSFYAKAAGHGEVEAYVALGQMYREGEGLDAPSYDEAMRWLEKAAATGDVTAMILLGDMALEGQGTKKSPDKAHDWYLKAHEAASSGGVGIDIARARRLAGLRILEQKEDKSKALKLLTLAMEGFDRKASVALARMVVEEKADFSDHPVSGATVAGVISFLEKADAKAWLDEDQLHQFLLLAKYRDTRGNSDQAAPSAAATIMNMLTDTLDYGYTFGDLTLDGEQNAFATLVEGIKQLSPQAIRELQSKLKNAGHYRGRIDGAFGKGTLGSLRSFILGHSKSR